MQQPPEHSLANASADFIRKQHQREREAIIQFVQLIKPQEAAELIRAIHQANEIIYQNKTNTLIINQRMATVFDWSFKEFNRLLDRSDPLTIHLPIGTQTDIVSGKKNQVLEGSEKAKIAQYTLDNDYKELENLGKIAVVDEAKSGNSIIVFLQHIVPILQAYNFDSLRIIAMADENNKQLLDQNWLKHLSDQYDIETNQIMTSLSISDKNGLLDTLIYDPKQENIVPHTLTNQISQAMIQLLSIAALYPRELDDLLSGHYLPNSDMQLAYQKATVHLNDPQFINPWLKQYGQALDKLS